MANQLGLRSPKCLTKIAQASQAETSGGPFDLLRSTDDFGPNDGQSAWVEVPKVSDKNCGSLTS